MTFCGQLIQSQSGHTRQQSNSWLAHSVANDVTALTAVVATTHTLNTKHYTLNTIQYTLYTVTILQPVNVFVLLVRLPS